MAHFKPERLMKKDDAWSAKNASIELGLLCSTWAPTANADAMRTLFDYNHWVCGYPTDLHDRLADIGITQVFLFDDRTWVPKEC